MQDTGIQQQLVNIPIQEMGIRQVLNDMGNMSRSDQTKNKSGKGGNRWKRATGKENLWDGHAQMEEKIPNVSNKRGWLLLDESDVESKDTSETFTKKQKKEVIRNAELVEKASLKWS